MIKMYTFSTKLFSYQYRMNLDFPSMTGYILTHSLKSYYAKFCRSCLDLWFSSLNHCFLPSTYSLGMASLINKLTWYVVIMNPFQNFHTTHTIKTFLKIVGQKTTILYLGLTSTVLSKNIMLLLPFMHSVHSVRRKHKYWNPSWRLYH